MGRSAGANLGGNRPGAPPLKVELDPRAEAELAVAARWYEDNVGRGMGERLLAAFDDALQRITTAPERWPLAPLVPTALGIRRHLLSRLPYGVLYRRIGSEAIQIVAVAHQKRKPNYWIDRALSSR